jgi:hypothetical protein
MRGGPGLGVIGGSSFGLGMTVVLQWDGIPPLTGAARAAGTAIQAPVAFR